MQQTVPGTNKTDVESFPGTRIHFHLRVPQIAHSLKRLIMHRNYMVFHTFAEREEGFSIEEPGTGMGIAFQELNLPPPRSLPGGLPGGRGTLLYS